jgi:hypothetical protein
VCGRDPWPTGTEPSLDELLSDPIALALRRSDGVTRREIEALMAQARQALPSRLRPIAPPRPPRLVLRLDAGRSPVEFDFDAEPELTLSE